MTRSTLRLAALSLLLSCVAVDASAQGLFGWRGKSNGATEDKAASSEPAKSTAAQSSRPVDSAPAELNTALAKAQISRKVGDFAEATKILSQLVLFAPDDSRVLGEYGKTLAAQGKSDDALAFLERAIQIQPGDWSFYSALGVAHDQKGEYKAAQAAYERALQLKPGETAALNNAALSYMQSGDLDSAERMIQQASATTTDKARIEYTMALVQRLKAARPAPVVPTPAPTVVASLAPAPEAPASIQPAPAEPVVETTPVASNTLPPLDEPVESDVAVTAVAEAPQVEMPSTNLASLQANPSVVMQAVPKDDLAGPVKSAQPKPEAPAQKQAAETPAARKQLSVSSNPPLTKSAPAETAPVQVTAAAPAPKAEAHTYYVQAGAFATEDRADKMAASLDMMGARVSPTTVGGRSLYRVRIGPFKDAQQANDALTMAKSMGHADVKVVAE